MGTYLERQRWYRGIGAVMLAILMVAGCSSSHTQPSPSETSGTTEPASTPSVALPSMPASTSGSTTSSASADEVTSTEPSAQSTTGSLTLFYVAEGDAGQAGESIGCNDSLVAVEVDATYRDQLQAAIEQLLADDEPNYGESGLYNALAPSQLRFDHASVKGDVVSVYLAGQVLSGGVCDDPRIESQLQRTATVAAGVGQAEIYVNDEPLVDILSGAGD